MLLDAPSLFERTGEGLKEDLPRLKLAWRLRTLAEEEREAWASAGVFVHGPMDRIHLAPGATLRDASLNTEQGHVLLGPDSEVMEGCRIRGPFALGEGSVLRMGALVYGATTIGSQCKVGGELSNVVVHDCSNKAHGGFLGNAVIGSWCNLGAETTCSNLKNTYGEIAEWNHKDGQFEGRGRTFCGLLIGDHSKTGIHTAFNTASVVGVMCNVFGNVTPPKHLPSFSWGLDGEVQELERALSTAQKVMARRSKTLTPEAERDIRDAFAARK
jgi:UDP-N-acetylglucosamine diphosphorylase/glucosamine-1-phosphate N-acetyltransferase